VLNILFCSYSSTICRRRSREIKRKLKVASLASQNACLEMSCVALFCFVNCQFCRFGMGVPRWLMIFVYVSYLLIIISLLLSCDLPYLIISHELLNPAIPQVVYPLLIPQVLFYTTGSITHILKVQNFFFFCHISHSTYYS